jgi:hypothetical protein
VNILSTRNLASEDLDTVELRIKVQNSSQNRIKLNWILLSLCLKVLVFLTLAGGVQHGSAVSHTIQHMDTSNQDVMKDIPVSKKYLYDSLRSVVESLDA